MKIAPLTVRTHLRRASARRCFVPITVAEYLSLRSASARGKELAKLAARLNAALEAKIAGATCECGEPIWALGSAEVGQMCFTCITGEAVPESDYELVPAK